MSVGAGELEQYAAIVAALEVARDGEREHVLASHGLDEARFDALGRVVEASLEQAIEASNDGVPKLVAAFDRALRAARVRSAGTAEVLSTERYAEAVRALRSGGDPRDALARLGLDATSLSRAAAHHQARAGDDPAYASLLARLLTGG